MDLKLRRSRQDLKKPDSKHLYQIFAKKCLFGSEQFPLNAKMFDRLREAESAAILIRKGDVVIPVMGLTGSGKSTFISHCTYQSNLGINHGLASCESQIAIHTMKLDTQTVHLIETPGFDDSEKAESQTLQELAYWLTLANHSDVRITGVIWLHRITDNRMQGVTLRSLNIFKKLCGVENYKSVVLATTKWDQVEPNRLTAANMRQKELSGNDGYWGEVQSHGGRVFALSAPSIDALRVVRYISKRDKKLILALQHQLLIEGRLLHDTDAGRVACNATSTPGLSRLESEIADVRTMVHNAVETSWTTRNNQKEKLKREMADKTQSMQDDLAKLRVNSVAFHAPCEELPNQEHADQNSMNAVTVISDDLVIGKKRAEDGSSVRRVVLQHHHGNKRPKSHALTAATVLGTGLAAAQLIAGVACNVM